MVRINAERFKALRQERKLSQKELAGKLKVDVGTISRWERGASTNIRRDKFVKLCEALGVTEAEICGDGPLPQERMERHSPPRGMNLVIDTACRNALALIARRYGVTRQQIVEAAPLLFFIMAEQSLVERKRQLEKQENALAEAEEAALPHLRSLQRFADDEDDRQLREAERTSIERRDLFAKHVSRWTERSDVDNPFAYYLTSRLREIPGYSETKVSWEEGEEPRYDVGTNELKELLGSDDEACRLIQQGEVALNEMPGDIRNSAAVERATWVKDKARLELVAQRRELNKFAAAVKDGSISFDLVQPDAAGEF